MDKQNTYIKSTDCKNPDFGRALDDIVNCDKSGVVQVLLQGPNHPTYFTTSGLKPQTFKNLK